MIGVEDVPGTGGVRLIIFNRPEARNAFNTAMYEAAAAAFNEAAADDGVRVLVMTGAGRAFTAGQDLGELATLAQSGLDGDTARAAAGGYPALLDAVGRFDKPLIAAVNGAAVGLGFTVLAHTDLVYVAESAAEAVEWGIALRAYPDDELLPAALSEAAKIARAPVPALRGIKRLMQTWQRPLVQAALDAEADGYAAQLGTTTTIPATASARKD